MSEDTQKELYMVGLRTLPNRPTKIWLKHYAGGVLNNFLATGEENSVDGDRKPGSEEGGK